MNSPTTITRAMYVAALEALGLEPDAVIGVNLSSKWIGITLAESDQTGRPIVTLGQLTPRQINIELSEDASADSADSAGGEDAPGDADEEGGAEVVGDADEEGDAEIADDADQEDEDDGDAPVDPAPPLEDDEVLS